MVLIGNWVKGQIYLKFILGQTYSKFCKVLHCPETINVDLVRTDQNWIGIGKKKLIS